MKPFWRYYGGKFRAAPRYPKPLHRTIVEPFAGAAGYSLRYHDHDVVLVERYAVVAEIWRFLIGSSPSDIRKIPEVEDVDELPSWVSEGGRALVGFCMNDAATSPCKRISKGRLKLRGMGRHFEGWCRARIELIASQVDLIKHWKIIEGDFELSPSARATWFVDPPYQLAGRYYKHTLSTLDYSRLAGWCRSRDGQMIVCENVGATWLPFWPWADIKAGPKTKTSAEAIWYSEDQQEIYVCGNTARSLMTSR
jgi:site-specific DNA-adenine methylase